jgi:hypothetical protein
MPDPSYPRAASSRAHSRSRRAKPVLEALEARGLLSHVAAPAVGVPPLSPGRFPVSSGDLYRYSRHKHPLNQKIVGGHVRKVPMFYGPFAGARTPNLDATGANGRLIYGQGFVFTGEVLGPISSTQPAVYTFGVNRGGASAPGPFLNRPMIFYDALVEVSTGPTGPTGTVQLLNSSGRSRPVVTLPSSAIQVSGNKVQVELPASLLPATSPPRTHLPYTRYFYAFWAGTSATAPNGIASFAPEYAITPVANEGFPGG